MTERTALENIGVVGCGLMGSGIAEVCARAGKEVVVVERDSDALTAGRARVERSLARAERAGKLGDSALREVTGRLEYTTSLQRLDGCDLIVEAVAESEALKTEVFQRLDAVVHRRDVILATNTSSIPIMKLAMATGRAEQVLGVHFFNPVPVLPLVELVPSLLTSEATTEAVEAFARDDLRKQVIRSQDRAGFVVNALLIPYLLSAIRMLESGFATAEDIDAGMVAGCAHPMGPLALADLIGLDTTTAVAESLYGEFKEPLFAPPPLLSRMVDAGLLGRKTGHGFYRYDA